MSENELNHGWTRMDTDKENVVATEGLAPQTLDDLYIWD